MRIFNVLVLLIASSVLVFADNNHKVKFLSDFCTSQTKPTTLIVLHSCFSRYQKVDLFQNSVGFMMFSNKESLQEKDFKENPQHLLFFLDLTCSSEPEAIIQKIEPALFAHPFRWILFTEDEKIFESIRALPDSDIIIPQTNDEGFILKQFYKIEAASDEILYENYGKWSLQSGIIDERAVKIISRRRTNLRGKMMTSSYVALNKKSRNHLTDFVDKNTDPVLKVNYIILNAVLDKLNTTRKDLFQGTWGYYNAKSKKWSGMVGDVVHKGADIGGTPLFMTPDRIPFLDYMPLSTPTTGHFIFRAPQLSAVSNIYTLPFRTTVWLCCLILVLISTVLLHLTTQTDSVVVDGQKVKHEKRFTDSLLSTIAAICQMDPSLQSNVTSSRIIMFFVFLAFSLLYAAYTANIVSLLQSPSKSIRTMEDLYKSKLVLGIEDTPYNRYFYTTAKDPFEIKVFGEKLAPPGEKDHFTTAEKGLAKLRKGLYAFIMEDARAYRIMEDTFLEHEKCDLVTVLFLNVANPILAIAKRSPYKEIIKVNLIRAAELGIQKRTMSRIYTKKPVCTNRQNFQSISIDDALPALLLIPYGVLFAFAIGFIEKILHLLKLNPKWCLKF